MMIRRFLTVVAICVAGLGVLTSSGEKKIIKQMSNTSQGVVTNTQKNATPKSQASPKSQKIAAANEQKVVSPAQRAEDLDELNFIEMINSVPLDAKSADLIRKFQEKEGRSRLYVKEYNQKNNCTVETYRNKEVLLVTIPASNLFAPNDTVLKTDASSLLAPLRRYLKDPDMYRVLMVMHTDNTGSEAYRDRLTESRVNSIGEWFSDQGLDTSYLFTYAFGDDMPLVENNSMSNREKNRRLEVYLVPGKKMLDQARKGRILF